MDFSFLEITETRQNNLCHPCLGGQVGYHPQSEHFPPNVKCWYRTRFAFRVIQFMGRGNFGTNIPFPLRLCFSFRAGGYKEEKTSKVA
jgi:hypothetical protein